MCGSFSVSISIHAPTRGATRQQRIPRNRLIFQSTLLQEERLLIRQYGERLIRFQSTLLQEERRCSVMCKCSAPCYFNPRSYKRSDVCQTSPEAGLNNFNPRSYKRSDRMNIFTRVKGFVIFQSTLLQEERHIIKTTIWGKLLISIHAPTRGATCNRDISVFIFIISIHAPTRGATFLYLYFLLALFISIHAPTRGATFSHSVT